MRSSDVMFISSYNLFISCEEQQQLSLRVSMYITSNDVGQDTSEHDCMYITRTCHSNDIIIARK